MRAPFIVLGTGRCGTTSLRRMLSQCKKVEVVGEGGPHRVSWYDEELATQFSNSATAKEMPERLRGLIQGFKEKRDEGKLAGIVAPYMLPHAKVVRSEIPDVKIVGLHRPKKEVVESFLTWKLPYAERLRPLQLEKDKREFPQFPIIDAYDIEQSYEFYWEMYEKWLNSLDGVYHMNMLDLNDREKLSAVFDYLEIPEEDRVYPERTRYNTRTEEEKKRLR